jgi:hypothetical protein
MSYKNLIGKNLNVAFNLIKDLKDVVELKKIEAIDFDFSEGLVEGEPQNSVFLEAIVTDVQTSFRDKDTERKLIMMKTSEIGSVDQYSEVVMNGTVWKIGPVVRTDRFISVVELYR